MCTRVLVLVLLMVSQSLFGEDLQGELLLQALPRGYEVAYQAREGNLQHIEWVPKGQSVETWSEMLTTQIFFGGVAQKKPKKFYEWAKESWKDACPSASEALIASGEENGYEFAFWLLYCDDNPDTGQPENTYFKAIAGEDSFYLVQKAWRRDPRDEEIVEWTEYFRDISVCDTRRPDRHPCPTKENEDLSPNKSQQEDG